MVCGPMDIIPRKLCEITSPLNTTQCHMRPLEPGTRCHQLGMFVIYESGIQMLADSPSNYEREKESTEFIASVPNTWDEIHVLEAKVGEYLVAGEKKR
ncbi:MAG: glycoside hydrolase family 97 catalytic domain-containing protein [Flavobacteriaceae bacterium]|nr:glycoside hydrolase family 97 catalytic domain-containing protein [Flavobacteriaceae bacterium]